MDAINESTTALNATAEGGPPPPLDAASFLVLAVTLVVFLGPLLVLFPPWPPRKTDALAESHTKIGFAGDATAAGGKPKPKPGRAKADDAQSSGGGGGRIESLFVYPVRSCVGIQVPRSKVLPTGLEFDRLFAFAQLKSPFPVGVDEHAGASAKAHAWELVTHRQFPLLATVQVELWQPDLAKLKGRDKEIQANGSEAFLMLRFPWRETGFAGLWDVFATKCARGWRAQPEKEILLPVQAPDKDEIEYKGYVWEKMRAQGEEVMALNMGSELPEELRLYLGVSNKLALFRLDPEASQREEAASQRVFEIQDSYPVHILNLASVGVLKSQDTKDDEVKDSSSDRHRANIVVSGLPPRDEDDWKSIKLKPEAYQQSEEAVFHVSRRTTSTSERDNGDGASKKRRQIAPIFENTDSTHTYIEVGMSLEVLER